MANKAAAQAIIDAIATGQANTAAEVRAMGDTLLSQLFPAPVRENTAGVRTITTTGSGVSFGLAYNLVFTKSGNIVTVTGVIQNTSPSQFQSNDILINITDSEYAARTSYDSTYKEGYISINFTGSTIKLLTTFGGVTTMRVNTTYLTND